MPVSAVSRMLLLGVITIIAGCAAQQPKQNLNYVSVFSEISANKFTVRVDAPVGIVRQYAICKAVWFAEKQHKTSLSLSNPGYSKAIGSVPGAGIIPDGWVQLTTVAYLGSPSPDGNPPFQVAEKAPICRTAFDWYH